MLCRLRLKATLEGFSAALAPELLQSVFMATVVEAFLFQFSLLRLNNPIGHALSFSRRKKNLSYPFELLSQLRFHPRTQNRVLWVPKYVKPFVGPPHTVLADAAAVLTSQHKTWQIVRHIKK